MAEASPRRGLADLFDAGAIIVVQVVVDVPQKQIGTSNGDFTCNQGNGDTYQAGTGTDVASTLKH
ncbi:MAG: hypothetical protein KAH54_06060 [Candidatus Sabulitectum sp.]|nr:hypothetical protein [Candidatus Sabulitectum sp.]